MNTSTLAKLGENCCFGIGIKCNSTWVVSIEWGGLSLAGSINVTRFHLNWISCHWEIII